ncbi:MAG TPA: GNAT family N-acetyltransferase [Parvularcula sp.]|nr:GNAT family N-acetyltransferase [Parvularcula sp.]HBS31268.1 GNAT family N-acetyltransferase [Parvularcula sp.]
MDAPDGHQRADIRPAAIKDAAAVADILADAFHDDPVMNWNLGSKKPIRRLFLELARGLYLKRGFGHLAGDEAASLWLPPGVRPDPPIVNELLIGAAVFPAGGLPALRRLLCISAQMGAARPAEPHYYLFAVGVRRRSQGRGFGGRLIAEGLKMAGAAAPAYLECSNPMNEPLYMRLGFERRSMLDLPAGAPPLSTMARAARAVA